MGRLGRVEGEVARFFFCVILVANLLWGGAEMGEWRRGEGGERWRRPEGFEPRSGQYISAAGWRRLIHLTIQAVERQGGRWQVGWFSCLLHLCMQGMVLPIYFANTLLMH